MKRRQLRVGELIRDILAESIHSELKDPRLRGLISITRVDVAPDYSEAKVNVSVFGTEIDQKLSLDALQSSHFVLEKIIRKNVRMRVTPSLIFVLDETMRKEQEFQVLLDKAMEGITPDSETESESDAEENIQGVDSTEVTDAADSEPKQ